MSITDTLTHVLAEHHPAGIVNSRDGWVECECGARLPVALDRDGYALDTDAERAAFDAHRANQLADLLARERAKAVVAERESEQLWKAGGWAGDIACSCGWRMGMWSRKDFPGAHRKHIADALLPLIDTLLREQAEGIGAAIEALPGPGEVGIKGWPEHDQEIYLLAIEEAATSARTFGGER